MQWNFSHEHKQIVNFKVRKQWEKWYTWYTVRISKRKGRELSFCREKLNDLLNSRIPWWKFMGELQFQFKRLFRQGTSKSRLRFPFFFFSREHYIYPLLSNHLLEFPFSSLSLSFGTRSQLITRESELAVIDWSIDRNHSRTAITPSVILSILFKARISLTREWLSNIQKFARKKPRIHSHA